MTGRAIRPARSSTPPPPSIPGSPPSTRNNRGFRQAGTGVVAAFYSGYELIGDQPWDYISKFDGDLVFEPDYFERCLREFEADPKLGVAGGTCCRPDNPTETESQGDPLFHVRGPDQDLSAQMF